MTTGKRAEKTKHDFQRPIFRSAKSSQLFSLHAPSSTDVFFQLLNQPNINQYSGKSRKKNTSFTKNSFTEIRSILHSLDDVFSHDYFACL